MNYNPGNWGNEGKSFVQNEDSTFLKARQNYRAKNKNQISFRNGKIIQLIEQNDDDWATGKIIGNDHIGLFPLRCVKVRNNTESFLNCDILF